MNLEPKVLAQRRGWGEGGKAGLENNSKCWALAAKWMEMLLIEMGKTIR